MSKKVKGQKVDLASFNGPVSNDILSRLPSAPSGVERVEYVSPSFYVARERRERGSGEAGGGSAAGNGGEEGSEGGRPGGCEQIELLKGS